VDLSRLGAPDAPTASWTDPRNGQVVRVGSAARAGIEQFRAPEGWDDALLLLETRPAR
jgi:hypothetical protein